MASRNMDAPILHIAKHNIIIRPYVDADAIHSAKHLNNPAVLRNLRNRIPYPYTLADAQSWIAYCRSDAPEGVQRAGPWPAQEPTTEPLVSTNYAIVLVRPLTLEGPASGDVVSITLDTTIADSPRRPSSMTEELIGSIGLSFGAPQEIYCRTAELGYWLSEEHWGRGIMSDVARDFVRWAFSTWQRLYRIDASVYANNVGSHRVLEKAGFCVEGRRRGAIWKHGQMTDEIMMGLVRDDLDARAEIAILR